MSYQPNRHVVLFTRLVIETGQSYDVQDRREFEGGSDVAALALATVVAEFGRGTRSSDGYNREIANTDFRLHSWYQAPAAPWGAAPMSGAENDRAWIDGPGSEAL